MRDEERGVIGWRERSHLQLQQHFVLTHCSKCSGSGRSHCCPTPLLSRGPVFPALPPRTRHIIYDIMEKTYIIIQQEVIFF